MFLILGMKYYAQISVAYIHAKTVVVRDVCETCNSWDTDVKSTFKLALEIFLFKCDDCTHYT